MAGEGPYGSEERTETAQRGGMRGAAHLPNPPRCDGAVAGSSPGALRDYRRPSARRGCRLGSARLGPAGSGSPRARTLVAAAGDTARVSPPPPLRGAAAVSAYPTEDELPGSDSRAPEGSH